MNQNLLPASECQQSIETMQKSTKSVLLFDDRINGDGIANKFEGSYGSVAQRHSKTANALFIDGHVERIQNVIIRTVRQMKAGQTDRPDGS